MTKLLSAIQKFNKPISFGNRFLYDMCVNNEKHPWGDVDRLADKIWLIGRSYAASPERRYYRKKQGTNGTEDRIEPETRGDGTGKYFREIAKTLCQNKDYSKLTKILSEMRPYCFNGGNNDKEQLIAAVSCVALFNSMIKEASKKYDKDNNKSIVDNLVYRNQISFCSKFLHFHAPDTVFIMDHFSGEGGRFLCSTRTQKSVRIEDCDAAIVKTAREIISVCNPQIKISLKDIGIEVDGRSEKCVKDYIEHCLRSYRFGCFLYNKMNLSQESAECNLPRMIDSIFQRVKKSE